ncbi:hypothetical protein [Halarcobacter mediterraneus]|uniref:hypothetical protein n=1 Tax=Halarcobacter mediterraneus TaxID=2023153 RepID=UPI0013E93064|nr:hypothetical protein [Halarcobacter mediterraneus]
MEQMYLTQEEIESLVEKAFEDVDTSQKKSCQLYDEEGNFLTSKEFLTQNEIDNLLY